MDIKQKAKQLKTKIPIVWMALKHKDTPMIAKILAVFIMVYVLSPIDFIPDFIPVIGYLDDIIIVPLLITLCLRFIPDEVIANCEKQLEDHPFALHKKWVFAVPFLLLWVIIVLVLIKWLW